MYIRMIVLLSLVSIVALFGTVSAQDKKGGTEPKPKRPSDDKEIVMEPGQEPAAITGTNNRRNRKLSGGTRSATSWVLPLEFDDPAFERYVDLSRLPLAIANEDASGIADIGLQLAAGEQTLLRSHVGITSETVLNLAVKVALQKNDELTAKRVQEHAQRSGDTALVQRIESSLKLAGQTRGVQDTSAYVVAGEMTVEAYAALRGVIEQIRIGEAIGDRAGLEGVAGQIENLPELTAKQREYLKRILGEALATVPKHGEENAKSLAQLHLLLGGPSRDGLGSLEGAKEREAQRRREIQQRLERELQMRREREAEARRAREEAARRAQEERLRQQHQERLREMMRERAGIKRP